MGQFPRSRLAVIHYSLDGTSIPFVSTRLTKSRGSRGDRLPGEWIRGPLITLDFETTDLDVREARMVQVALLWISRDLSVRSDSLFTLVDPGKEVPESSRLIHGITTARARTGRSPRDVLLEIRKHLITAVRDGVPLVVFNARYDWPLLRIEAQRQGITLPQAKLLDPLVLDRALDRFRAGRRTLEAACAEYGVAASHAHDAAADAAAAAALVWAICERYEQVATQSLDQLQINQAQWFDEWRHGYIVEQAGTPGEEVSGPDGGWPIPDSLSELMPAFESTN